MRTQRRPVVTARRQKLGHVVSRSRLCQPVKVQFVFDRIQAASQLPEDLRPDAGTLERNGISRSRHIVLRRLHQRHVGHHIDEFNGARQRLTATRRPLEGALRMSADGRDWMQQRGYAANRCKKSAAFLRVRAGRGGGLGWRGTARLLTDSLLGHAWENTRAAIGGYDVTV